MTVAGDEFVDVAVTITRWVDDTQPGVVEFVLTDGHGRKWLFIEKISVVMSASDILTSEDRYPQRGAIRCALVAGQADGRSETALTIDTSHPWGIESVDGQTNFEIAKTQLVETLDYKIE